MHFNGRAKTLFTTFDNTSSILKKERETDFDVLFKS